MEIGILICGIVQLILLVILLIKTSAAQNNKTAEKSETAEKLNGLKNQIEVMQRISHTDSSGLMDQVTRQGDSAVKQMAAFGENIAATQERQQNRTSEMLARMEAQISELRRENKEELDKINHIVTEKMQKLLDERLNGAFEAIVKNMSELGKTLNEGQDKQQKATVEKLEGLGSQFEGIRREMNDTLLNIRNSNTESMEKLRRENQESLDKINNTVNEKLQKTLDDKIAQSFETVNKRLAEVYEGLGEMKNVAAGVSDLKNVLANVKTRGIMGEIQLDRILSEILAAEQYAEQVSVMPGGTERVDFAVRLPGMEDKDYIYLPIDAKFPGDTYANLLDAYNLGDPEVLKEKRKLLENEILRCAKSIRDKYIVPPHTTNFAVMFLPFEGLYAEVVNMGLVERLQRECSVNIAGPSTMAAMLNSLQMGFKTLAIQKKSGEVWKILEAAKKEFATFEKALDATRKRLRQADEELENLIGTRTRAINRKLSTVSELPSAEEAERILEE